MTTIGKVTRNIKQWRKSGQSFEAIAVALNVSKADVWRITLGKYPGEKVAERLGIPVVCHTCNRKVPAPRQPRRPEPKIGRDPGWIEYWMKK